MQCNAMQIRTLYFQNAAVFFWWWWWGGVLKCLQSVNKNATITQEQCLTIGLSGMSSHYDSDKSSKKVTLSSLKQNSFIF